MILFYVLLGVYLVGLVISWWVVIVMSIDTDWTFSQMGLAVIWPLTIIWLVVLQGGHLRDFPRWVSRHWG